MKRVLLMFGLILMFLAPQAFAAEATFENLVPPTAYTGPGGGAYYKGSDGANGFASGDAWFGNSYYPSYGGWAGFAYSNTTDTTTSGYTNQFSAYAIGSSGKKSKGVAAAS